MPFCIAVQVGVSMDILCVIYMMCHCSPECHERVFEDVTLDTKGALHRPLCESLERSVWKHDVVFQAHPRERTGESTHIPRGQGHCYGNRTWVDPLTRTRPLDTAFRCFTQGPRTGGFWDSHLWHLDQWLSKSLLGQRICWVRGNFLNCWAVFYFFFQVDV